MVLVLGVDFCFDELVLLDVSMAKCGFLGLLRVASADRVAFGD